MYLHKLTPVSPSTLGKNLILKFVFPLFRLCLGDQVSRRGAMTGGYLDTRRSRMAAQRMKNQLVKQVESEQAELQALKRELENILENDVLTLLCGCLNRIDHLRNDVMQHIRTRFPTIPGLNSMWTFRCIGREGC